MERKGDIRPLVEPSRFRIDAELHREIQGLSDEAMRLLEEYGWPGNLRELENVLTRAGVLARRPVIERELLDAAEAAHVQRILNRTRGNKREGARLLGISRPRLDRLIEKHRLTVPQRQIVTVTASIRYGYLPPRLPAASRSSLFLGSFAASYPRHGSCSAFGGLAILCGVGRLQVSRGGTFSGTRVAGAASPQYHDLSSR